MVKRLPAQQGSYFQWGQKDTERYSAGKWCNKLCSLGRSFWFLRGGQIYRTRVDSGRLAASHATVLLHKGSWEKSVSSPNTRDNYTSPTTLHYLAFHLMHAIHLKAYPFSFPVGSRKPNLWSSSQFLLNLFYALTPTSFNFLTFIFLFDKMFSFKIFPKCSLCILIQNRQ